MLVLVVVAADKMRPQKINYALTIEAVNTLEREKIMKKLLFAAIFVIAIFCGINPHHVALAQSGNPTPRPTVGPFLPSVWPIDGASVAGLSSTYGPRQKSSENDRYDWHRGIDIPTPCHTPIKAIADGKIRLAGDVSGYQDTMVQIRHTKP